MRHIVILLLLCVIARAQDALTFEAIVADKSLWPQDVMVTVDHKLPVVIDGKVARVVKKGPGVTYRVKEITKQGVSILGLGSPVTFQADETDVIARAENLRAEKAAAVAVATPEPAPAPRVANVALASKGNLVPSIELPAGFEKEDMPFKPPFGKVFIYAKENAGGPRAILMLGVMAIPPEESADAKPDDILLGLKSPATLFDNYKETKFIDSKLGTLPAREVTYLGTGPGGISVIGKMIAAIDGNIVVWAQMYDAQPAKSLAAMTNSLNTLKWVEDSEKQAAPEAAQTPSAVAAESAKQKPFVSRISQAIFGTSESSASSNPMAEKLRGQLVTMGSNGFQSFDSGRLAGKKYIAVYFSASWCGPCRRFTPKLVDWYKVHRKGFDNFELIFVSADDSANAMASYMSGDGMEWPAVEYSRSQDNPLSKYAGNGIPCLVILDENGTVVAHSYEKGQYVGPVKPLTILTELIKKS